MKASTAFVGAVATMTLVLPSAPASADAVRDREWHLKFLNISAAHKFSTGSDVVVAIVDTGVHPHPDIKKNLVDGTSTLPSEPGNGQKDENGHGTAMAGLIAGHGRNGGTGVLGIAPQAKIMSVKIGNAEAIEEDGSFTAGIEWAAQHGAQVINVSGATGPSVGMRRALEKAAQSDAVVVASSGNRPQDSRIGYPAALPGVLAVGAVDRSGQHTSFSIEGDPVQICAPGVEMETTRNNDRYSVAIGTSPAAAIVSGAAALVRARFPDLSAQEVIERLTSTATDIGPPGRDEQCGFGVLNIVKALTADGGGSESASPVPGSAPTRGQGEADPASDGSGDGSIALLAGIVGGGIAVLGGLVALVAVRRRRRG